MVQVVVGLPSVLEALGSIFSTEKKNGIVQ
jgi:hypothetical protein